MKTIKQLFFFSVLILLSVTFAFGQNETPKLPIDNSTGKIAYSGIVMVKDSASKDELFKRAKICFVHLFKSSNSVIQNEDKEAGTIIGKGIIKVSVRTVTMILEGGYINFTLTVVTKDGRYKYTCTDFVHEGTLYLPSVGNLENDRPRKWREKWWNSVLSQTDTEIQSTISSMKLEMNRPSPQNEKW